MIAVAEACRNIVCSGGEPLAVTNNLNFGNPYVPEVYWQFVEAVQGMGEACKRFSTPVTGGNVSFYNQSSDDGPVFPTPTIGMLGLMDNPDHRMTLNFKNEGDLIYLVGPSTNDIASSEYLYSYLGIKASPAPYFDFEDGVAGAGKHQNHEPARLASVGARRVGWGPVHHAGRIGDGGRSWFRHLD